MDKHEIRQVRKISILQTFDTNQLIGYLKTPAYKRTDQMLEYLKLLLMKMKINIDVLPIYIENCYKELAMHYKLLQKCRNELILTDPCDFYIILNGEIQAKSELMGNLTLGEGSYIGENCFISQKINQCKLICVQNCTFAYISYKNFNEICLRYSISHLEMCVGQIKHIPCFSDWPHKKLLFLASCFRLVSIERNCFLFQEGEPCEFVYIVKTGEVEMVKFMPNTVSKSVSFGKYGRPINLPENKKSKSMFHCSIKTQLEIIGDEEANNDLKYKSSCKCYSFVCVLYRISKSDYKKYMRVDESRQNWKEKNEIISKRMQKSLNIPNMNKKRNSISLPSLELKMKILNNIKTVDPWNLKSSITLSSRSTSNFINKNPDNIHKMLENKSNKSRLITNSRL